MVKAIDIFKIIVFELVIILICSSWKIKVQMVNVVIFTLYIVGKYLNGKTVDEQT